MRGQRRPECIRWLACHSVCASALPGPVFCSYSTSCLARFYGLNVKPAAMWLGARPQPAQNPLATSQASVSSSSGFFSASIWA